MEKNEIKCNHDLADKNNTLVAISKKRTMVSPEKKYYFCKICKRVFCFLKSDLDNPKED